MCCFATLDVVVVFVAVSLQLRINGRIIDSRLVWALSSTWYNKYYLTHNPKSLLMIATGDMHARVVSNIKVGLCFARCCTDITTTSRTPKYVCLHISSSGIKSTEKGRDNRCVLVIRVVARLGLDVQRVRYSTHH